MNVLKKVGLTLNEKLMQIGTYNNPYLPPNTTLENRILHSMERDRGINELLEKLGIFQDITQLLDWLEGNLLDLGSGKGNLMVELKELLASYEKEVEIFGMDLIQPERDLINFRQGNFNNIPFENEQFNRILSIASIAAYAVDENNLITNLQELYRVLKVEGKAILTFWISEKQPYILSSQERLEDYEVIIENPNAIIFKEKRRTAANGLFKVKIFKLLKDIGFECKPIYKNNASTQLPELIGCEIFKPSK